MYIVKIRTVAEAVDAATSQYAETGIWRVNELDCLGSVSGTPGPYNEIANALVGFVSTLELSMYGLVRDPISP